MSDPFNTERYKKLDEEADGILDRLKASKWTPFIFLAVILALLFAYILG